MELIYIVLFVIGTSFGSEDVIKKDKSEEVLISNTGPAAGGDDAADEQTEFDVILR